MVGVGQNGFAACRYDGLNDLGFGGGNSHASGAGLAARTDVRADRVTVVRRPAQLVRLIQGVADDLLGR